MTGTGDLTVDGAFNWVGGTLSGTGTVDVGTRLDLHGTTLVGRDLVNHGTAVWHGGDVNLAGGASLVNDGTFELLRAASSCSTNDGVFTNLCGKLITRATHGQV